MKKWQFLQKIILKNFELSENKKDYLLLSFRQKGDRYASQEMFLVDKNKLAYGKGAKQEDLMAIKFQNKRNRRILLVIIKWKSRFKINYQIMFVMLMKLGNQMERKSHGK